MTRVLIVDDDKAFLESLIDGMEQYTEDTTYESANNGRQALDILGEKAIDVLVTDLKMPKFDGFELIARVVKDYPDIPCIVMTAYGTPEIERAFDEYSIAYIEKPIDIDQLHKLIVKAAETAGREGQLKGISLASFLQMVEMEQKTCRIDVHSSIWGETGILRFAKGKLFDAELGDKAPLEAALTILAWQDCQITVRKQRPVFKRKIQRPMMELQMEAARLADEANKDKPKPESVLKAESLEEALQIDDLAIEGLDEAPSSTDDGDAAADDSGTEAEDTEKTAPEKSEEKEQQQVSENGKRTAIDIEALAEEELRKAMEEMDQLRKRNKDADK